MMKTFNRLLMPVLILAALIGWLARRQIFAKLLGLPAPRNNVTITRGIGIPMRDGATLIADRFLPDSPAPHPIILIRSPYGRNIASGAFGVITEFCAMRFAERGFGVVVQDVRGRFDSGSAFVPFTHERDDGLDTLDWLSRQDWCASVGMWGSSYLGIVQWAAADHPVLRGLMPTITASDIYGTAFQDGVFNLDLGARWLAILNLQEQHKRRPLLATSALVMNVERSAQRAFQHLPLIDADDVLPPGTVRSYRQWLNEHHAGENLRRHFPHAEPTDITAPTLLVGGWYDFFLRGLLEDYAALREAGRAPRLVIGAWTHYSYGFLMLNTVATGVEWFGKTLRGDTPSSPNPFSHAPRVDTTDRGEKGRKNQTAGVAIRPSPPTPLPYNERGGHSETPSKTFPYGLSEDDAPVRLFVMGSREWRSFDTFPPSATETHWHLSESGRLDVIGGTGKADTFRYDPAAPPPMIGGAQFSIRAGVQPNHVLERRPDVLVYTSPPLTADTDVIGFVRAEFYVRASCPTADFFARLCVVDWRGRSLNLCDGLVRLSPSCAEIQGDGSVRVGIDLGATAYHFKRGDRVRLLIAGSGHPRWTRHTGGDDPIMDTSLTPIDQTVYHDTDHPSVVVLPVV